MAKKGPRQFNPDRHCGAKTRQGRPCIRGKGERTDHPGQGRCWRHGGRTPIKHGHYSKIVRPNLHQLIDQIAATATDLLNLEGEALLLKALVIDYVNRFDQGTEALIGWHGSYNSAVQTLLTSNDAAEIKSAIVKLRESVHSTSAGSGH